MWIPTTSHDFPEAEASRLVAEAEKSFSGDEHAYLARHISAIAFEHGPKGLGGYFDPRNLKVGVNTRPDTYDGYRFAIPGDCRRLATLVHELMHPLLRAAAQNARFGYFIIQPGARREVQERAKAYAPKATAEVEKMFEDRSRQPNWEVFTPQERIAAHLYCIMDDRYYDLFGSTILAKVTGLGYTAPSRDHEIGCNLKALKAVEEQMTGKPAHLVEELAGDMLQAIDQKVSAALKRNPNLPPVAVSGSGQSAGAG